MTGDAGPVDRDDGTSSVLEEVLVPVQVAGDAEPVDRDDGTSSVLEEVPVPVQVTGEAGPVDRDDGTSSVLEDGGERAGWILTLFEVAVEPSFLNVKLNRCTCCWR